jgi:hypothetical protein
MCEQQDHCAAECMAAENSGQTQIINYATGVIVGRRKALFGGLTSPHEPQSKASSVRIHSRLPGNQIAIRTSRTGPILRI